MEDEKKENRHNGHNGNAWFDTEEEKFYEDSVGRVKAALIQGMTFEQAAALLDAGDPELKEAILDDSLKVVLAESHFIAGKPIKELAESMKLPVARLDKAKKEMLKDIEDAAIETYKTKAGQKGNA